MCEKYQRLVMVNNSMGIPVHYMNKEGNLLFSYPEVPDRANPLYTSKNLRMEITEYFAVSDNKDTPFLKLTDAHLTIAAIPAAGQDGAIIILGPIKSLYQNDDEYNEIADEFGIEDRNAFKSYFYSIGKLDWKGTFSAVSLVCYMENGKTIPQANLGKHIRISAGAYYFDKTMSDFLVQRGENGLSQLDPKGFDAILKKVSIGDAKAALKAIHYLQSEATSIIEDSTSAESLQDAKETFFTLTALVCVNAIGAGVEPEKAYRLCKCYIRQANRLQEPDKISYLTEYMICDYSRRICDTSPDFTYEVKACQEYIQAHLHERIGLTEVSEQLGISPRRLSSQFKMQTGISIPRYIQLERIDEAKNLLRLTNKTIVEVSNMLDFSSQCYFSSVFTKYVGMSPGEFRSMYATLA